MDNIFEKSILDKGYVRLIDWMGNINTIVDRQRISYNREHKNLQNDIKLVKQLLQNGHMTPFEQVYFEWELKVPIFVQRQLVRYRLTSINEVSGRYSDDLKYEYYLPNIIRVDGKDDISDELNEKIIYEISKIYDEVKEKYNELRKKYHVTKELQRIIEPLGSYTIFRWSMNLRELIHIFEQRLDKHQQYETRETVKQMYYLFEYNFPILSEIIKKHLEG